MSRRKPKIDESVERDEASEQDFTDAFKMLLQDAPDRPRSENRQPTTEELRTRWRLHRRDSDAEPNAAE